MLSDKVRAFLKSNHAAVLTTHRGSGGLQMSIVTVGLYGEGAAHTTTESRAKFKNLRRDPRCSLLVSADSWRPFLVLEGKAEMLSRDNTPEDKLRAAYRDVYRSVNGKDHANWVEYEAGMLRDERVVITVVADKVYGPAAA